MDCRRRRMMLLTAGLGRRGPDPGAPRQPHRSDSGAALRVSDPAMQRGEPSEHAERRWFERSAASSAFRSGAKCVKIPPISRRDDDVRPARHSCLVHLRHPQLLAQAPAQPDWTKLQDETMQHYQAVLRLDTRNPPGNETVVAEYLKQRAREGRHPGADRRLRSEALQPDRAAEGQRQEEAAARSWATATWSRSTRRSGSSRRSARRATAATSTAAARSTTRTTSPPR